MVDVEFSIEANEEIMAAASAANEIPLIPAGAKFLISHGYASSDTFILPAKSKYPCCRPGISCGKLYITYAVTPGITTIKGIRIFKNAAKTSPF